MDYAPPLHCTVHVYEANALEYCHEFNSIAEMGDYVREVVVLPCDVARAIAAGRGGSDPIVLAAEVPCAALVQLVVADEYAVFFDAPTEHVLEELFKRTADTGKLVTNLRALAHAGVPRHPRELEVAALALETAPRT